MNHGELVNTIQGVLGLSGTEAKRTLEAVFGAVGEALAAGDEVVVNGFGKFKVRQTAARTGRNPATGAEIAIPAARKASFAPAKALKDSLA